MADSGRSMADSAPIEAATRLEPSPFASLGSPRYVVTIPKTPRIAVKRLAALLACLLAVAACANGTGPSMSPQNGGGGGPAGTDSLAYAGAFHTLSGPGQGSAQIYFLATGGRQLRFTSTFSTEINPNVEVWLVDAPDVQSDSTVLQSPHVSLGSLQSGMGAQSYAVPDTVDLARFRSVTVWCVAAQVVFTTAPLMPR